MQNKEFQKTEIYKDHVRLSKSFLLACLSPLEINNFYLYCFSEWFEKLFEEYCGKGNLNNNNTTLGKRKAEEIIDCHYEYNKTDNCNANYNNTTLGKAEKIVNCNYEYNKTNNDNYNLAFKKERLIGLPFV